MARPEKYYHGADYMKWTFAPFPMIFFWNERYRRMKPETKNLYVLLMHRSQLSFNNGWCDENDRTFFIFSRDDMAKYLGISKPTAIKAVKQLIEYELLEERPQGFGKPNKLYLLQPDVDRAVECFSDDDIDASYTGLADEATPTTYTLADEVTNTSYTLADVAEADYITSEENDVSHVVKSNNHRGKKSLLCVENDFYPNNKEKNNKKYNNNINRAGDDVKEKIRFEDFKNTQDEKTVGIIAECIADVLKATGDVYRLGKKVLPLAEMQDRFKDLDKNAVLYVLKSIKSAGRISHLRNYIKAVLYNYCDNKAAIDAKTKSQPKNDFHDFNQREYDYDALLKEIKGE